MRTLLLISAVAVGSIFVACSAKTPCSAANCSGCCDSTDTCVAGTAATACGVSGNACTACSGSDQVCTGGLCVRSGTGGSGGSGGGSAGGTATGGGTTGTGGGNGGAGGSATGGGSAGTGGGTTVACPSMALPPQIAIDFPLADCPAATACGGNPQGTFSYTAACIPRSEFTGPLNQIGQACGANNVTITGIDGGLAGVALFRADSSVCRQVIGSVTVNATISGACAAPIICTNLNGTQMGYTVACQGDGGVCACSATRAISISNDGVPYTTTPTTLRVTGTGQVFDTCLTGATFTTRETDAGTGQHEPGTATLTHQ